MAIRMIELLQAALAEQFDKVSQDVRFAARSFRRTPGFAAAIVLTLALGIGANTAIFSALHALLLRPLPFPEPDRLMEVSLTRAGNARWPANDDEAWSFPKYLLMRDAQHVFADLGLYLHHPVTVRGGGGAAERVEGEAVAGRYFETLRVRPILGRSFLPEEVDRAGAPAAMLIGESLWQERFNADPSVLGRTLDVDGTRRTIVGVMPSSFAGLTGRARVWMPLPTETGAGFLASTYSFCCAMVARLAPGVTVPQAESAVRTLGAMMDAALPDPQSHERWGAAARPLDATRVDPIVRRSLLVLASAAALVLMITCANVANLLLVRAARREREIAVRLAIGASRGRLVRQLITDSLCLAIMGGLAAVGVAAAGVEILEWLNPASSLRLQDLSGLGVVNVLPDSSEYGNARSSRQYSPSSRASCSVSFPRCKRPAHPWSMASRADVRGPRCGAPRPSRAAVCYRWSRSGSLSCCSPAPA